MKKLLLLCAMLLLSGTAFAYDITQEPTIKGFEFYNLDEDKDGVLDYEDMMLILPPEKRKAFADVDENGDGKITAKEWDDYQIYNVGKMPLLDALNPNMAKARGITVPEKK